MSLSDQLLDLPREEPVHRLIFRAQSLPGASADAILCESLPALPDELGLETLCVFGWGRNIFVYAECPNPAWTPEPIFASSASSLEQWPGEESPRTWVPMMDIFHYQRCVSRQRWQRNKPPEKRLGRVIRLRSEMVSSYIFHHFQLQEEASRGAMVSKGFGTIAQHENLLFFYTESPNFVTEPYYPRRLSTQNTPADWASAMTPHFLPWGNPGKPEWRDCRLVAAI